MTLCSFSGYSSDIIADPLVVDLGGKYMFNGVTLEGDRFVPNTLSWDMYFALEPNCGVAVSSADIALLVDGQAKWQTSHDSLKTIGFRGVNRKFVGEHLVVKKNVFSTVWNRVVECIKETGSASKSLAPWLAKITEWERASEQTLWQAAGNMREPRGSSRLMQNQILASNTRWLLCHTTNGYLVAGESGNTWGRTRLRSAPEAIELATPIKNGWFIETLQGDRYLLLRDGDSIKLQSVVFPYGKWEKHASWTFWPAASSLLTPTGRMVAIPECSGQPRVLAASTHWFFLYYSRKLTVVDTKGEKHTTEMPKQYSTVVSLRAGNNSVLILRLGNGYYHFSLANASDWPFQRCVWESAAFPDNTIYQTEVIRGDPDVFVVLFEPSSRDRMGIYVFDGRGNVGYLPTSLKMLAPEISFSSKYLDDGRTAIVEVFAGRKKLTKIKIDVLDGLVQADSGTGVTVARKMVPIPAQKDALLQILNNAS